MPVTYPASPASGKTKQNWSPIIQVAVEEVFSMMVGGEAKAVSMPETMSKDFTAMVGLAGAMCGVFTVICPMQTARAVASSMLGDPSVDNSGVMDAMGEICNMVAGNFKAKVAGLADGCMLSVPTVVAGADYEMHSLADGERFEMCFDFQGSLISVTLQLND